jgi:hypothetical protein
MHPGGALGMDMQSQREMDKTDEMDVVPLRANRQLCVRHKQMANQDVNQKLQRVSSYSLCKRIGRIITERMAARQRMKHREEQWALICSRSTTYPQPKGAI